MAGLINLRLLTDFFNKIDPEPTSRRDAKKDSISPTECGLAADAYRLTKTDRGERHVPDRGFTRCGSLVACDLPRPTCRTSPGRKVR